MCIIDTLNGIVFTIIYSDEGHTIAVDDEGQIWSSDRNNYRQLGHEQLPQIIGCVNKSYQCGDGATIGMY